MKSKIFGIKLVSMLMFLICLGILSARAQDSALTIAATFDSPGEDPAGLASDGTFLWIADIEEGKIYKWDNSGTTVNSFDSPGSAPIGLAAGDGYLWISDTDEKKIYKLDSEGILLASFDTPGTRPTGLACNGTSLWIADADEKKIYELDKDGTVLGSFDAPGNFPTGLASDGTYLWMADADERKIYKADTDGTVLASFDSPGNLPSGLASDGKYLWISDGDDQLIYKTEIPGASSSSEGYMITSDLWIMAVIRTAEKGRIEAVWKKGGEDTTAGGHKVVWGYFYASPDDVNWGSPDNPDLFVKIWFDASGRTDVNFFHVSVPDIEVYSAYPYKGEPNKSGVTTLARRYIRQYYYSDGSSGMDENYEDGNPASGYAPKGNPAGYSTVNDLRIGSIINTVDGPVEAVWQKGGDALTAGGHRVVWGHFYANPKDVNWGSRNNPDLFVKIWFDAGGRVDVNYFHVSVPDIEVFSDLPDDKPYNQKGTTILADRYIRHEYHQYALAKIQSDYGDILIWLYNQTPNHKANFLKLAESGFYDGLIFHRVINDFVIQGGDPKGTGSGSPGYVVDAEIVSGLTHVYGAVAAARTPDSVNPERKSSGSQFYIVEDKNGEHGLDGAYTVFGLVIDGMKTVETIASLRTDENDKPLENVYMRNVEVIRLTDGQLLQKYNFVAP